MWKKELRISQTHNGRNLDLFLERERWERERDESVFVKRREKVAREEGKGGVSNFEKRHNTDLFPFLVFKYISHLYYVLFYVFFIFSNGKRQKKNLYYY